MSNLNDLVGLDGKALVAAVPAQAATGNRVTVESIEAKIKGITTYLLPETTITKAVITMENGFFVTGESACADPANFDAEIGKANAINNAFDNIWPLEGYLLKEKMYEDALLARAGVLTPEQHLQNDIEVAAKAAHEMNRAYCQAIGDDSQPAWEEAPQWQKDSAIAGVKFHIANPDADPAASHQSWLDQKVADGWKYGPVKDVDLKEHPCCVPYDELPTEQKAKDHLFRAAVRQFIG